VLLQLHLILFRQMVLHRALRLAWPLHLASFSLTVFPFGPVNSEPQVGLTSTAASLSLNLMEPVCTLPRVTSSAVERTSSATPARTDDRNA
jgi:hypothetical protein